MFGTDALPGLINAGIDCIEHGTGLTDDLIAEMARRGTALVPTLINVETFPGIADVRVALSRPTPRTCARCTPGRVTSSGARSRPGCRSTRAPTRAGRSRTAGSSTRWLALHAAGHPDAVGAASWAAREWLGRPSLRAGHPADLVVYRDDPRADPAALREPVLVMRRGRPVRTLRSCDPTRAERARHRALPWSCGLRRIGRRRRVPSAARGR